MSGGITRQWLTATPSPATNGAYRHFHIVEDPLGWDSARNGIIEYFRQAHDDAIQRLRTLTSLTLHPAGAASASPYSGYPYVLPLVTLQGYFGEIMAAWLAETHAPSGSTDWEVPAHLFRYHLTAFQYLERLSQTGVAPTAIVGRTGDDCLGFKRNADGTISAILFCEAKCTATHDAGLISEAHEKATASAIVDIPQLIEILSARGGLEAQRWIDALHELHFQLHNPSPAPTERHDLVCYVHSQVPQRNATWIPTNACHASYTAQRPLNAFEVRLSDVVDRLRSVYAQEVWP